MIQISLDELRKNSNNPNKETLGEGLGILLKLINNLIKDPNNEKYRAINETNKAVQAKLLTLKPKEDVHHLIEALGYTHHIQDQIYVYTDPHMVALKRGAYLIKEVIQKVNE